MEEEPRKDEGVKKTIRALKTFFWAAFFFILIVIFLIVLLFYYWGIIF